MAILALGTVGCGNSSPPRNRRERKAEKPPAELEKMKKSLAELGTMLEKRRSPEVEVAFQAEEGGQGNQEGEQQQGGKSQGGDGSQEQQGGQNRQAGPQSAGGSREWREEMDLVRALHREWTGLEPEAVSKGMSKATQEALETNLCDLTRAIESRQALEAQLATNQVYRYYIEAAALFKTGIPSNLERVRYHVMEARLQGVEDSWTEAQGEASKALEIWRRLSYSLDKIERQTLNQLEHSLTDLVEVVTEQSGILTSIKTEIALQNLDKLEREIKGTAGGE